MWLNPPVARPSRRGHWFTCRGDGGVILRDDPVRSICGLPCPHAMADEMEAVAQPVRRRAAGGAPGGRHRRGDTALEQRRQDARCLRRRARLRRAGRTPNAAGAVVRGLLAGPVRSHVLRPGVRQRFLGLRGDLLPHSLLARGPHPRPGGPHLRAARARRDRGLPLQRSRQPDASEMRSSEPSSSAGPWATGLALRLRRELAVANEQLRVEQEEKTRRAVAEERSTIARELHDVVAHAISVTVLQSRGARRLLGRDEESVRRALDAIEHTNTQALGDMRRLLAVLRDTEGDAATTPAALAVPARRAARRRPRLGAAGGGRARPATASPCPRRRPVGVPDRPGGPDQRAQARRAGDARRSS